ncbi:hypothetical protein BD324DRAFT_610756 [Kockovaella imperatae]|uniref:Mog1p/PsbP-like protein n=1 Tax=Kockovaella imperatae TaxID=4999 RepID=A0A1Y1UQW8_9TREE|nr:hypothetical protein BD324DRAFT_610756 [Kockovaella imperatae]ORX40450.1 hypothetical protein BD324DRAFT_610756 [Kockovaella imperatae]
MEVRELFGGAMRMELPGDYIDASDLRQIPDNQEVFLSPSSDTSLVVEVLDWVEEGGARDNLWEAVKFHFESIAHDNDSLASTILTSSSSRPSRPTGPQTPEPITLTGTQRVHKFSHSTGPRPGHESDQPDEVFVGVALWRVWIEGSRKKQADVVCSVNVNMSKDDKKEIESWWLKAVKSLQILDWDLFVDA